MKAEVTEKFLVLCAAAAQHRASLEVHKISDTAWQLSFISIDADKVVTIGGGDSAVDETLEATIERLHDEVFS